MEIWQFDLLRDNGHNPREGACLLDAVSWFEYGTLGDHPACVCPVIACFARAINDMLPDDRRQELKPFILRLPGTVDPYAEMARAEFLAWAAVRTFAPLALEAAAELAPSRHSVKLRRRAKKLRGQTNLYTAQAAAWAARRAADAVAEVAAWNPTSTAVNVAGAARKAGDVAMVSRDTDRTAAIYNSYISALDGVLRIGKQAPEIALATVAAANRSFALARA